MDARVMDGYKLKAIARGANRAVRPMVEHAKLEKKRKRTMILASYEWPSADAGCAAAVLRVLGLKADVLLMKATDLMDFPRSKRFTVRSDLYRRCSD